MNYGSGTGGLYCICAGQTLRVHSPGGNTTLFCMKGRRSRHLKKRRTILPNFIPIQFEMTCLIGSIHGAIIIARSSPQPIGAIVAATIASCIHYRRPVGATIAQTVAATIAPCICPIKLF